MKTGWKGWKEECDYMMSRWVERVEEEEQQTVEQLWASWYGIYVQVVDKTIGWRKKKKRGKKRACRWDRQISVMKREMKKLTREMAAATVGDRSWLEQKRRAVRKSRRKRMRELRKMAEWMRMREIEELGKGGDKKMMWNRLRRNSGEKRESG